MVQKPVPAAQKVALAVEWIRRTAVAHTLKDLEKALPSVASVKGPDVKEFLQGLTDENLIRVEKIGSGNWYWSFLSDEKIKKEQALAKAEAEKSKATAIVEDLQAKIEEATAAREEDEDMLLEPGMDRETLMQTLEELENDLRALRTELAAYSENDPVEVERKRAVIAHQRVELGVWTDAICSMEVYFKRTLCVERGQLRGMLQMWYGDEFDAEVGGLREI